VKSWWSPLFFVDANILELFGTASRYNQAGTMPEEVRQYKLAGRL
jgi:hypothetical protein